MFEAFSNYSDFSGRASRSEFWLFQLLNFIVMIFALLMILFGGGASVGGGGGGLFFTGAAMLVFWLLIAFIPNLAVTVRRFHDHNISGWWYLGLVLFGLIPFVGLLANLGLLWVLVRGGTWGPNRFGPDPVNPWRNNPTFA
ncbi:MAG: DUF805 domain-containing protein [Sphingomicrobium sp.]